MAEQARGAEWPILLLIHLFISHFAGVRGATEIHYFFLMFHKFVNITLSLHIKIIDKN